MDTDSIIFKKALAVIKASGAKFRIVMPSGEQFGDLPIAAPEPERKRRKLRHPYGVLRAYYLPFVKDIQPGQVIDVPFGNFLPGPLMSGISAHFCHSLGNGKVTTAINRDRKVIEVLRVE
jgi:hypothetical protein